MSIGVNKRQKEQTRLRQRQEKEARREERKRIKKERPPRQPGDEDPDLAGIVAGPQPVDPNL